MTIAMTREIFRGTLGIAAEYAVASELCLHGVFAQLTFGHQKKTDLLVFFESGGLARVEVKAKRGREWPNCKGISGPNTFIVFVDYEGRELGQRPDFFILDAKDWRSVLDKRVAEIRARDPKRRIEIVDNVSVFVDQIGRDGKPYKGMGIRPSDIEEFKVNDGWKKISGAG